MLPKEAAIYRLPETAACSHPQPARPCADSCKQQKYNTQALQKDTASDTFIRPLSVQTLHLPNS